MVDIAALSPTDLGALITRLRLVDPTDPRAGGAKRAAPRLPNLQDASIGMLDNRKPNAMQLLATLGGMLIERHDIAEYWPVSKFIYSRPAEPEIVERLTCLQAVITAIGD